MAGKESHGGAKNTGTQKKTDAAKTGAAAEKGSAPSDVSSKVKAVTPEAAEAKVSMEKAAAPAVVKGRLAVVIDDAGYDLSSQRIYEGLGIPLTLAVMPNQSATGTAAAEWASHGLEVILHQPMESISGEAMERTAILTSMSDEEIRTVLTRSLRQVPQAIGMNNHQGSKATADGRVMAVVMREMKNRGLFYLDSRTNQASVGASTARAYGVPAVSNELFIDNSTDEDAIRSMIRKGADIALRDGHAVIIGHCRPHTAAAFSSMVGELKSMGIEFIFVSSLVH